jgi:uncharacterized protein (TIGR02391 family)
MEAETVNDSHILLKAAAWAQQHSALLCRIGEHFLQRGEWPDANPLARDVLRDGDASAFDALQDIPAPYGFVDGDGKARLLVRGLATVPGTENVLHEFVRVLWLAEQRLLSHEERPTVSSKDLVGAPLNMNELMAQRVGALVLGEDWMFGSGHVTSDGNWERDVNERTRFIAGVKSVSDYLRVEGALRWSGPAPIEVSQHPQTEQPAFAVADLHPLVAEAAMLPLSQGDEGAAVQAAWFAVRDLVRQRLGFTDLDGTELMERIGKSDPKLALTPMQTESERNMHVGLWHFLVGAAAYIRNPEMHESVSPVAGDRVGAMERLALLSLCARHIDAAASPIVVAQAVAEATQPLFVATDASADDLIHSVPSSTRSKLVEAILDEILSRTAADQQGVRASLRVVLRRALHRLEPDAPEVVLVRTRLTALIANDATLHAGIELLTPAVLAGLAPRHREKVVAALVADVATGSIVRGQVVAGQHLSTVARLFPALGEQPQTSVVAALEAAFRSNWTSQAYATRLTLLLAPEMDPELIQRLAAALVRAVLYDSPWDAASELEAGWDQMPEALRQHLLVQLVLQDEHNLPGHDLARPFLEKLEASA